MQLTKSSLGTTLLGFSSISFALPLYLLLLSGFPTVGAFKVCAMIFVQIVSGSIIWAHIMRPKKVDIIESVGMGLAIGSILTVIGHQLLLQTALNAFGWLSPVVVAAIVLATSPSTKGSFKNFVLEDVSGLFFVALAVVSILKQWWWLLPLSLPTGLALYLLSNSGKNKLRNFVRPAWLIIATIFVVATLLMVYLRQLNLDWWIRSWDLAFFESRSYSVAKFGQNENISLAGYPIQYHWFGLAWLGSTTVITNLGPWLAISQVAPVYSVVAIGCLIFAIAKRTSSNQITKYAILFQFAFSASIFSTANTPNITSLIWFFATIVAVQDFFKNSKKIVFATVGFLAIATLSTKVSAGFTLLAGFALTDIWLSLKSKSRMTATFLRLAILLIGSIASFYLVIGGPDRNGDSFVKFDLRNSAYYFGVDPGREATIYLIGSVGFILVLLPSFLGLFVFLKSIPQQQSIILFCSFGLLSLFIPSLFMEDNLGYFVVNAKILALIGSAIALTTSGKLNLFSNISKLTTATFFSLALVSTQTMQEIYDLNWREISLIRGGPTTALVLILVTYYLISFVYCSIFTRRHCVTIGNSRIRAKFTTFVFFLLIGSLAPPIVAQLRSLPSQAINADSNPLYIGSVYVSAASEWLNINSADNEIVATNRFCVDSATPRCLFPKYSVVSATSRRIMLVEGPFYLFGRTRSQIDKPIEDESFYPSFGQERLDLSRGFADKPNAEITAKLREYGVDWFYLFKENTTNRNWEPYGTVKYENTEVAIIQLNDK